jgi:succinate dehydrogenase/fumarate reductase iron-sulfur protein
LDLKREVYLSNSKWKITFKVFRKKVNEPSYYDLFVMEVDPDEYVLDGIERIWAFHDRSLTFKHACHHSVCGACAMRINGVEKLTCITPIHEVAKDGGEIKVEPLDNFPVVSDLVVDMSLLYRRMEQAEYKQVVAVKHAPMKKGIKPHRIVRESQAEMLRLSDCIECGMCISACPVALTTPEYLGPGVLAAIQTGDINCSPNLLDLADSQGGVWRCHSVYECTEVCPSFVEPGWRIMDLRRKIISHRVKSIFMPKKVKTK